MSTLDDWLGRDYHARNIGGSVDEKFIFMLNEDSVMRKEAGKRLAQLTDNITQRDYISKINRECLERVLPKVNQNG